ncbi:PEP/pyruvate-binding domain-containing protein [Lentzea guizhouensis]|uniref:PEP/pyruvate-binding domain-containing protein n=1 Tax=Lentzea guizhouensis TaxID=1586287 RepID=UPI000A5AF46E|nr:PEP/pyruvate-binding domain-containing protein [Lentzea guizhouensis]
MSTAVRYVRTRFPPQTHGLAAVLTYGTVVVLCAAGTRLAPVPVLLGGLTFVLLFFFLRLVDDVDDGDAPGLRGGLVVVACAVVLLNLHDLPALAVAGGACAAALIAPLLPRRGVTHPVVLFVVYEVAPLLVLGYGAVTTGASPTVAVGAAVLLWSAYEYWKFTRKLDVADYRPFGLGPRGRLVAAVVLSAVAVVAAVVLAVAAAPWGFRWRSRCSPRSGGRAEVAAGGAARSAVVVGDDVRAGRRPGRPGLVRGVGSAGVAVVTREPDLAGAKARGLAELADAGFAVPPWRVIGADVLRRHLTSTGLAERIEVALLDLTPDTAEAVSEAVSGAILETPLGPDVLAGIEAAAQAVGGPVAVRSSGLDEDGPRFSFAGQFDTFLNIGEADVADHVRKCWAGAYSARALAYRLAHGLPAGGAGMAVIIQRLVRAEKSGVLFTANPMSGERSERVVSAVFGLGEGLVGGAVDADTVVLDAAGQVLQVTVGEKRERYDPDASGGCRVTETAAAARDSLAVTDGELRALCELAARIEQARGGPQDVEWAIAGGTLWVVQTRPITAGLDDRGELHVWDNSNIIESFRGMTSPLTYSFARRVYQRVYEEYCRELKVPDAQLAQAQEWLPALLGYFHGRVYYNLLNWYRLVRLAPLYRLGRRSLELTLGVEESLDPELADGLHPFTFGSRAEQVVRTVRSRLRFASRFALVERTGERFIADFYRTYEEFGATDYDSLTADQVYRRYQALERTLVARWGRVAVLDAVIGLSFGTLQLLNRRWLPDAPLWFTWAVAGPANSVESAGPAHRIAELAEQVRSDDDLRRLVTETPAAQTRKALLEAGHIDFVSGVDDYVARYGDRSLDELKLEAPSLRDDPSTFFPMLRAAVASVESMTGRADVDAVLDSLSPARRRVYERVRGKVRRALELRERIRFCRTRAFGTAKVMIRAIGRRFTELGLIDEPEDVFWLYLEEIGGCFDASAADTDLRALVRSRKAVAESDALLTAPLHHPRCGRDAGEPGGVGPCRSRGRPPGPS